MRPFTLLSSAALALLATLTSPVSGASLLAIDYGTDSFKASLVKPGVPFDVLVTKEGRRKTQSLVTLRKEDRSFGGEAANLATRFPQDTFSSIKLLLGHPSSHPQSQLHQSLYSSPAGTTARGSPSISSSSASFPVEEILAMQLTYAKEMADEVAGESVRDVVVTVPGWFGQSERQAVLDATELAGLRCIGLVNDGTAAAVNYAMTRTFPATPSYHLFYDLGSGSLRTTLVSLKSAMLPDPYSLAAKPELKNVTSLVVHGNGFDTGVGGYYLDRIVRDIMIEEFESTKGNKKLAGDKRAMAKLLKEASRVKQVLSANGASQARIEGLVDDTDFRTEITREQLESRAKDLLPRFVKPIHDALADANLTMADIESVILVGGSSRVPMVQAAVAAVVGEEKIAKNVNADEAAVLGAALYGAGITRGFRTKDIRVQDITPFGIDVTYEADKASDDAEPRTITTHLFPALSKTGVKKTMTFKKTGDFAIHFAYRKTGAHADAEQADNLFETTLTGLTSALTNLTAEQVANATVKVVIELSESNVVTVNRASVILAESETNIESSLDKIKGLLGKFGSKGTEEAKKAAAAAGEAAAEEGQTKEEEEATQAKLDELLKLAQPTNSTVKLTLSTVNLDRVPMSEVEKTDARKRLREVKAAEQRKLAREEARNVLEAFIYKVRDLVEQASFVGASLEHERKVIKEKTEEVNEWLWDEGESAATKELKSKKNDLEKLVKIISTRATEAVTRPGLIASLLETLTNSTAFHTSAVHNDSLVPDLPKYTKDELSSLSKLVEDAKTWLSGLQKKQDVLKAWEDPVLKVADLEKKIKDLVNEVKKLAKKKAPRKKKVSSKKEDPKNSTTEEEKKPEAEGEKKEGGGEHKKDEL